MEEILQNGIWKNCLPFHSIGCPGRQSFDTSLKSYNLKRHHEPKHDEIYPLLYPAPPCHILGALLTLSQRISC